MGRPRIDVFGVNFGTRNCLYVFVFGTVKLTYKQGENLLGK